MPEKKFVKMQRICPVDDKNNGNFRQNKNRENATGLPSLAVYNFILTTKLTQKKIVKMQRVLPHLVVYHFDLTRKIFFY